MWAPRERCCTKGMPLDASGGHQHARHALPLCRSRADRGRSLQGRAPEEICAAGELLAGRAPCGLGGFGVGEPAIRYLTELVHRRPRGWWVDVDRLHNLLQSHGPEVLGEAMEEGLNEQRFDVSFVEEFLQG